MRTQGRLTCNCAFCCCSQRSPTPVGLTAEVREHCDGLRTSCPAGVQQHSSSKAAGLSGPSNELMLRRRDVDHTWRGRRYCCAAAPCAPARGAVPIWAARESRGRGWAPARPRGGAAVPDPARRAGAPAPVFSRTLYSLSTMGYVCSICGNTWTGALHAAHLKLLVSSVQPQVGWSIFLVSYPGQHYVCVCEYMRASILFFMSLVYLEF